MVLKQLIRLKGGDLSIKSLCRTLEEHLKKGRSRETHQTTTKTPS